MEFLKEILGDELYSKVEAKINEHNGSEANKENQIKVANLGGGEYVSKGKFDAETEKLMNQLTGKDNELKTANDLIADFKKNTKGNDELQGKITGYETEVANLQKQLAETKIKSALQIALLSEKATDIDYLSFKLDEKLKTEGKALELDENDKIKGWDDILSGLKTQLPQHFESTTKPKVVPNRLPNTDIKEQTMSKDEFNKLGYNSRVKLKEENPELYAAMIKE